MALQTVLQSSALPSATQADLKAARKPERNARKVYEFSLRNVSQTTG